jgi:hypothetical protein
VRGKEKEKISIVEGNYAARVSVSLSSHKNSSQSNIDQKQRNNKQYKNNTTISSS